MQPFKSTFLAALFAFTLATVGLANHRAGAAENLRLAPELSFTDDSSSRFPIEGDRLGDGEIGNGRVTLVFFGAAHCWNTNREAERVVSLYPKFRDRVRFVIVDVNRPSNAQRALLGKHYEGYIPTLALFASDGKLLFARPGETARKRGDTSALDARLTQALDAQD